MLLSHFLQPISVSLWRSRWAQVAAEEATQASRIHLWLSEEGLICPGLKNHRLWQLLILFQEAALIFSMEVWVEFLLLSQGRGSHYLWRYNLQGNHELLQTGELPLQLICQFCLPCLPKSMHHLACFEWHVIVKKINLPCLIFFPEIPSYSLMLVEMNYI